ncbi:hypothetical protein ACQEVZ_46575 [Dactylosporangium sp. CA-152071]|uniref:hypothetical protein n=1 Tax=Dactylosporangium sp. CA-152071 TaxID=3239933 RepID=UPI003D92AF16
MDGVGHGLQQEWDEQLARARFNDARAVLEGRPPLRGALALAARGSALGAFHPFKSHDGLWFCAAPLPGAAEDILPVGIGIMTDPDEYVVWWEHPFRAESGSRQVIQLLTVLLARAWDGGVSLTPPPGAGVTGGGRGGR